MTGHSAHDAGDYVPKHLWDEWAAKDPIVRRRPSSASSHVITRPMWTAARPMMAPRFESAARRTSLCGLSFRMASSNTRYVVESSKLLMLSQRVARDAGQSLSGSARAFESLARSREAYERLTGKRLG